MAVLQDVHKCYGSRAIYEAFSLTIRRQERWAVMGRNGAGKSTLGKMLAKKLGLLYLDTGAMYRAVAVSASPRCS